MTEWLVAADGHALVGKAVKCMCTRRMGMNQQKLVTFTNNLGMEGGNRWPIDHNGIGWIAADIENLTVWYKRIDLFILIGIGAHFERGTNGVQRALCLALLLKTRLRSPLCCYVSGWSV